MRKTSDENETIDFPALRPFLRRVAWRILLMIGVCALVGCYWLIPKVVSKKESSACSWPYCYGTLEIQDGKAKTVLHNRAALRTVSGFVDLPTLVPYSISQYYMKDGIGYGLVRDGSASYFKLVWHPGATKPPSVNPDCIHISKGRCIKIGWP